MLHLKFALNLENLADKMIGQMKTFWNDPFKAPIVIFPDPKLEQWFRLRWVKKHGVLANLNKSTIDRFLFNILVGEDDSRHKLTADILANVILAYLMQEDSAKKRPHWQTLGNEVKHYLFGDGEPSPEDHPDENRLFDFATKMAALFLEYETSRPAGFARNASDESPGILEKWNQENLQPFFADYNAEVAERDKWQRELYSAIFHDHGNDKSLLTQAFEKENTRKGLNKDDPDGKYLTIPYLYMESLRREAEGGAAFYDSITNGLPVFIFGLSGMGQFYRVILQAFAKKHEIHAYIQNPCMEFWEDTTAKPENILRNWKVLDGKWDSDEIQKRMSVRLAETSTSDSNMDFEDIPEYDEQNPQGQENDLLVNWGRSGRDNIKLWCQASNYDFNFEGIDKTDLPQDSLLHKVQYAIAHRTDLDKIDQKDVTDGSLSVTAAPTRIREIENLHTQICKLLQAGGRVEDILVVSPCLDDYRTAISVVFDQTSAKKSTEETGYLHVPFAIVDSPAKSSLTENALKDLFSILDQQTITRPVFFSLIRNPVVQSARGIQNEDVDAWQDWVAETNTYRTRNGKDDWLKVINRLLLAQMTANDTPFNEETIRPYSNMACSDKASLCRFIECVKAIEKWIDFGKGKSISDLEELSNQLNNWIGMQKVSDSLKSESIVYKRVFDALSLLYYQVSAGLSKISRNIVKQTLLLAAQGTEYSCGNLFVNGITFMKFAPNRTLPVKHLFLIGADATSFPGSVQQTPLDLRKTCKPWPGDDSPVFKNRYAFLCQFMSTAESFHLSYVNRDIKKDAELYPSSVINDLRKFIEKAPNESTLKWRDIPISLDETRNFDELWTMKSLRNKVAYDNMMLGGKTENAPQASTSTPILHVPKPAERVSFSNLSKFLFDPFQFKVGQMLKKDDEEDLEKETFEPACFDNLDTSIILKKMLQIALSEDSSQDNLESELRLTGEMPAFETKQWTTLKTMRDAVLKSMGDALIENIKKDWSYDKKIPDLCFETEGVHWILTGSLDWCDSKELNQVNKFIEVTSADKVSSSRWLTAYVKALALLAIKDAAEEQTIEVHFYCAKAAVSAQDPAKTKPRKAAVTLTPKAAREKLEAIYTMAYIGEGGKVLSESVPYDLLNAFNESPDDPLQNKSDLIYNFKEKLMNGPWANFSKKNLFDPLIDVGFSRDSFQEDWHEVEKKMISVAPQNKPAAI